MEALFSLTNFIQLCSREKSPAEKQPVPSQSQQTTVPYESYDSPAATTKTLLKRNNRLKKDSKSYQVYNCRNLKKVLV